MRAAADIAPRRRVRERREAAVFSTPGPDGHVHCIVFDPDGDGQTSPGADGHVHAVDGLEVQAAKGHTHELSSRRCDREHNARANHVRPRGA